MSKNILIESTKSKFQVLAQKPANVLKRIKGVLSDFGSNRNGRIYPRELWENVINSDYVKEMINSHGLVGELDHPEERLEISLQEVSHVINDMWIEGDQVMGIIDILPTPNGKIVNELLDYGTDIGISSRGAGSVGAGNVVDPDYQFITFDFVARPSCEAARLNTILEGVKVDLENNSEDKVNKILEGYKSSLSESNGLVSKCKKAISNYKKKLEKSEFGENFGQDYVRKLKDEFDDLSYSEENKQVKDLINDFDDWCSSYVPNKSLKESAGGYVVSMAVSGYYFSEVQANSIEEAKEKAEADIVSADFGELDGVSWEFSHIRDDKDNILEGTQMDESLKAMYGFEVDWLNNLRKEYEEGTITDKDLRDVIEAYVVGTLHIRPEKDMDNWVGACEWAYGNITKSFLKDSVKVTKTSYKLDPAYKLTEALSDQEVYKIVLGWYKDQIEAGKMTLNQCYELLSDKAKVSLNKLVDQSKIRESVMTKEIDKLLKESVKLNEEEYNESVKTQDSINNLAADNDAMRAAGIEGDSMTLDQYAKYQDHIHNIRGKDTSRYDITISYWDKDGNAKDKLFIGRSVKEIAKKFMAAKDKYDIDKISSWSDNLDRLLSDSNCNDMEEYLDRINSGEPTKFDNDYEEYDDGDTNWAAEEEADATERFENRYMGGGNGATFKEAEEFKPNGPVDDIKKNGTGDLGIENPLELNTGVLPVLDVGTYGREDYIFGWDDEDVPEDAEPDWEELDRSIVAYGAPVVEEYIKEVLPSASVKGTGVYHPREYNFANDELEFTVSYNPDEYKKLEDKTFNDPAFKDFLKERYSDRSGFFSYLADNLDEFYQQDGWKRFVQVIMFNLRGREEDFMDTTDRFWEDIVCNGSYVKY